MKNYKTRWIDIVVYCVMFACAAVNIAFGVLYITGIMYDGVLSVSSASLYAANQPLKSLDITYGVFIMIVGLFAGFAGMWLITLTKRGSFFVNIFYGAVIFVTLLYFIIVQNTCAIDTEVMYPVIINIIVTIVIALATDMYLDGRNKLIFKNA